MKNSLLLLVVLLGIAGVENASAYIDPGAGSQMLQRVFGPLVGLFAALSPFFSKKRERE